MKTQLVYQYEIVRANGSFTELNIIADSRFEANQKLRDFINKDERIVYDYRFIKSLICVG